MALSLYGLLRGHGLAFCKGLGEGILTKLSTDSTHHPLVVGAFCLGALDWQEEWQAWPLGDPIKRLARHLIALGEWSEERQAGLEKELDAHVVECWKEAVRYGTLTEGPTLDPLTMFEDVFKEMPPHLVRQQRELAALLASGGIGASGSAEQSGAPSPAAAPEG